MVKSLSIGDHQVGEGSPGYIVAEVGQAHEGSLRFAHSFIDSAATAGADAVKFQHHIPTSESTVDEPFRVAMGSQDTSRYEYWARTSFSVGQWYEIKSHCDDRKIEFLCSPFSFEAVGILRRVGVKAWKVASGEVFESDFIEHLCQDNIPLIASTGLASYADVNKIVAVCESHSIPLAVLQCTTEYPTPLDRVGLNVIERLEQYGIVAGLSDHSGQVFPSLAALSLGASIIEIHVTFNRDIAGPDTTSSLTFEELRLICESRDAFHKMNMSPVDKDLLARSLGELRNNFRRSVTTKEILSKDTILTKDMLTSKKPGWGIPWSEVDSVVGKRLKHNVEPNRLLTLDDLIL